VETLLRQILLSPSSPRTYGNAGAQVVSWSTPGAAFAQLTRYYNEREICDIVWLVASEHINNMTNIGLGIGSDGFCELAQRAGNKTSAASGHDGGRGRIMPGSARRRSIRG
jgi:hypothetical protein